MSNNFITWLTDEIVSRGWSNSELARRAGISPAAISMVMSGQNRPGNEFCLGIARALGIPPEDIFRKAGLLPDLPYGPLDQMTLQELHDLMRNLTPRDRRDVLEYARMRYRLLREDREQVRGNKKAQAGSLRSGESPA
jgi:transcriptional regulator with XRE-family HTH domain